MSPEKGVRLNIRDFGGGRISLWKRQFHFIETKDDRFDQVQIVWRLIQGKSSCTATSEHSSTTSSRRTDPKWRWWWWWWQLTIMMLSTETPLARSTGRRRLRRPMRGRRIRFAGDRSRRERRVGGGGWQERFEDDEGRVGLRNDEKKRRVLGQAKAAI